MLFSVSQSIGLPALAGLVLGESAGLPIPGETALIVAGGLASTGQLSLPVVIAVAAISAMLGDMAGYWVGRRGGRKLLLRPGRFSAHRISAVEKADRYFARYGLVTVFFARFVPGVRVVGALAAGATQMRFRSFAIANAGGCWAWATTVGTIAYLVGPKGAGIMIIIGFSIAGIGTVSAIIKTRTDHEAADDLAEDLADGGADLTPLDELATYAESIDDDEDEDERATYAKSIDDEDEDERADDDASGDGPRGGGAAHAGGGAHGAPVHATGQTPPAVTLAACTASDRLP